MNEGEYEKMYRLEGHYWWFVGRRSLALSLFDRHFRRSADGCVLDLGCGTGAVLQELQCRAKPVGLDMSDQALAFSRSRGLERLVRGRGEAMPFRSGAFAGAIALDVFEHIEDDEAAFREVFRAIRPGGILVLSVPAFRSLWGPHDVALMHHRRYRKSEVEARLRGAGFEVVKLGYSVFFLFPVVVVWRFFEKRKRGPATASLVSVPKPVNSFLIALQGVEARLIGSVSLPWGSSVVAVARRPGGDSV